MLRGGAAMFHNPTRFRNLWIRNLGEYDKP